MYRPFRKGERVTDAVVITITTSTTIGTYQSSGSSHTALFRSLRDLASGEYTDLTTVRQTEQSHRPST